MRFLIALALSLVFAGSAAAVDRGPPAQRTGPITIIGSGSTGDVSGMSVTPLGFSSPRTLGSIGLVGRSSTKNVYVATDGLDTNDGLSPLSPKQTLQAAVNAANPNGRVTAGAGTYTLSATLAMQPGVRLECLPGAQIVRASGTSFASLIDFNTNAATGGSIDRCAINDNLAGNAVNANAFAVNVGAANDVRVTNNAISNALGYGIYVNNGLRPTITGNTLTAAYVAPIAVIPTVASAPVYATIEDNRVYGPSGQHAIILNNADYSSLSRNKIVSQQPQLMNVSTSGTTVTWVSGNDFTNAYPGQFITLNSGIEYLITAKASNTSLTVNSSPGTLTNTPAVIGDGDLLSVANSAHLNINANNVYGGGAGGIVVSNFIAASGKQQDFAFNNITNNIVSLSAHSCISLQASTTTPATLVYDNAITGNYVHRCGIGKNALLPANRAGISVFDFTGSQGVSRTTISGNTTRDDLGNMLWGINLSSVTAGQVFAGANAMSGAANPGVGGAISSVALGAGWGTTASVSAIQSFGSSYSFTITSGGTGQSANALITVTTPATTLEQPPVQSCKMVAGTGNLAPIVGEQNASAAQQVIAFTGTPTAGSTYTIYCR